jgi:ATP-dependent helicase/nuclease subunit B
MVRYWHSRQHYTGRNTLGVALFGAASVYSISGQARFADSLAHGLLETFTEPQALARVQIFLPNRRAIRALSGALLRCSDGKALILPRLLALGDIGDDDVEALRYGAALDLPPPLNSTQRLLAILPLVSDGLGRMYQRSSSFADSLRFARALLRIFDQLQYGTITRPDIAALSKEGDFADHWQRILQFLDIALTYWPEKLRELGASDPVAYRIAHIEALTARFQQQPPTSPIIAAGTTGTIPAVRALLKRITALPKGCIILPPLPINEVSDAELWSGLGPTHPGYALKILLDALDRTPESVANWPFQTAPDCTSARSSWATQAFLPADLSHLWRSDRATESSQVRVIEAAHPAEEAVAIALAMRNALDTPDRTIALVTPDRQLARRVTLQLRRFDIDIDDSAGTPLAASRPATFLALLNDVALQGCAPVALLALLKHPLCQATENRLAWLNRVRQLDAKCLRGPRPASGLSGLRSAAAEIDAITPLVETLDVALGPWIAAHDGASKSLATWVDLHSKAAEALAGNDALWQGVAGRAVALQLQSLETSAQMLDAADYAMLLRDLLQAESLRPTYGKHPRLAILGPLEARLQRADFMILAGLNEGVWPEPADIDPVLNEAMRRSLGLPTSEFRIGQSAMDFLHGLYAPEVLISRAQKSTDGPTIASRFLQRLDASRSQPLPRDLALLEATRGVDQPAKMIFAQEPLPKPPLRMRPRDLYVTDIERLRRNPYAFYARKILQLTPLDELDADPGAVDRGIRIHEALERFFNAEKGDLLNQLKLAFADMWDRPQVQALWMPRFILIADWITMQQDPAWQLLRNEHSGHWQVQQVTVDFTMRGRADRIDVASDGSALRIIDYKTGSPPSMKQVLTGFALQLPLLALMAQEGGFADVDALPVTALEAWVLKGSDDKAGEIKNLFMDGKFDKRDDVLAAARKTLQQLITVFDKEETPYAYKSGPARDGGQDYHHLARVDSWQGRQP